MRKFIDKRKGQVAGGALVLALAARGPQVTTCYLAVTSDDLDPSLNDSTPNGD